jgi:hypothetical protein
MADDVWEQEAAKMKGKNAPSAGAQVYTGISAEPPAANPKYQGVSTPPNEGAVTGTQSDFGPQDPAYKLWAQPDEPQERFSTQLMKEAGPAVGNLIEGAGKGLLHTMAPIVAIPGKVQALEQKYLPALPTRLPGEPAPMTPDEIQKMATPEGTMQNIGYGGEQTAEYMLPGGLEDKAALKAAEFLPKLGRFAEPLSKIAMSSLGGAGVSDVQGGSPVTGAELGAGGAAAGQALQGIAPGIAESGLRVRGNQRLFGRTPGEAILEDTTGVRPATIAKSAQAKINQLEPEISAMDAASAARGDRGSLAPARDAVENKMAGNRLNRATDTVQDIKPIADFLDRDKLTGLPLSENQSAPGLRAMKRGLNSDYIGKWSLEQPAAQKGAARLAYGKLNQELHNIVPESKELDQRVSSLIPVAKQGERVASEAPTMQRALGRFGAHTGALVGAGVGSTEGYREGGLPGAVAGGLTGVFLPELLASPEGQMVAARMLHGSGGLRPIVGAISATSQYLRNRGDQ